MKYLTLLTLLLLCSHYIFAQNVKDTSKNKDSVKTIGTLKGDILTDNSKKVENYYETNNYFANITAENKSKILVTKGWLDTTKEVKILFGKPGHAVGIPIDYPSLKNGYTFSPFNYPIFFDSGLRPITLRIVDNNLLINADILGFGGTYLAKIRDNKLETVTSKTFEPHYTNTYFEVFESEYNIPVLQIELANNNQILLTGIFGFDKGWLVSSAIMGGISPTRYEMRIKDMPKARQDSLYDNYINEARAKLKPIHESE